MKKILALLLALLMVAFVFVGCDSTKDETPSTNDSEQTPSGSNGSVDDSNSINKDNQQESNDETTKDNDSENSTENNDVNLEIKNDTWEPTIDNLVGIGYYVIDGSIPFEDGEKIDVNDNRICYCYYKDLSMSIRGDNLSTTNGRQIYVINGVVKTFGVHTEYDKYQVYYNIEQVFEGNGFCVVYVYEIDGELSVIFDATVFEDENFTPVKYDIYIDDVKWTVTLSLVELEIGTFG